MWLACFLLGTSEHVEGEPLNSNPHSGRMGTIRQVLSYFLDKPLAVESLEDIARWRLPQAEISRTVEETSEAIEWLVDQGVLERLETQAAGTLFRLKATMRNEAEQLVTRMTNGD